MKMAYALILAGGSGTRLGADIPKQYIEACGRPVIAYCIECLSCHEMIGGIQIVAEAQWHGTIMRCLEEEPGAAAKFRGFSAPGENRQLSVYNGLEDMRKYADDGAAVLIHDAARPMLSGKMVTECLDALRGHDGVVPVLPVKDTVYRSLDGKRISALLKRDEIYAGQAPEAFLLGKYYEACRCLLPDRILEVSGSAEPAALAGLDVVMIPGDAGNFKITTAGDLERFMEAAARDWKRKGMERSGK